MSRLFARAVVLLVLLFPTLLAAQAGEDVIRELGAAARASDPTFVAPNDLVYRVAWDVNVGAEQADGIVPGFRRPASFLLQADDNGVPRENVHLAIIVYGSATRSLLSNQAYRTATGTDNASIHLLQALHDAGVQIIVCGEALVNRNVSRSDLLPFVKVATSATMARAVLHAQGYAVFWP